MNISAVGLWGKRRRDVDEIILNHISFDGKCARAEINICGVPTILSIESMNEIQPPRFWGDVWLPFAIWPAMKLGCHLRVNARISRKLARNIARGQGVLARRHPDLTVVRVTGNSRWRSWNLSGRRKELSFGQFFSGGVDSFFSLSRNPEVTRLIYIYDKVNEPPEVSQLMRKLLRSVSDEKGTELLEASYDIRAMLDNYADWGSQAFISVLSGIAAFFSGELDHVVVSSQYAGTVEFPWADHFDVNNIWGSGSVAISFDSGDVPRPSKVAEVSKDPVALRHLRVCWTATDALNCSLCEKCLRTMVAIEIAGASRIATTFAWPLDMDVVAAILLENEVSRALWIENLNAARAAGRTDLECTIQRMLSTSVA